ncbi:MAG: hypothetical protein AB1540_12645 [Bdellovibrionota bacterium]
MSRKNKFDLRHLVHSGFIKDGETLFFVSDPAKKVVVTKQPNGDFKVKLDDELITVHAAAQKFLGQEPPDHASRWLRNASGQTLYQLWQDEFQEAA